MLLNESQTEISRVLKFLYLVENIEKVFVFLSEAKTYNAFNARVKDLRIYEKLYGFIIERTHCKKPYNKSVKVSAQCRHFTACHGKILISYDFNCTYSTKYGSDGCLHGYAIYFEQQLLTISEAIRRLEYMQIEKKGGELL
jgi:hypothetical protein